MQERRELPEGILDYELEDRLREWARWARTNRRQLHCASIEHKWDSAMWNGWRDKGMKQGEVSLTKAAQIEAAVCYIGLTHANSRHMLIAHYVRMANPRATARVLRISIMDYDAVLWSARGRVADCLQNVERQAISQAYRESVLDACRQVDAPARSI